MKNIITYKLKETECDNYFKNKIYNNNSIENKYVKGDYFEAATKFGLLKLKLPYNDNYMEITLNEIVSMDKIIKENALLKNMKKKNSNLKQMKK